MDSIASRLAITSCNSATRSLAAQSPAMKVSAKPMSPDRSTALHSVQLCRRTAAWGSPAAPLPNRAWLPSGSCTSSVPTCRRRSIANTARAAAGADGGRTPAPRRVADDMAGYLRLWWGGFAGGTGTVAWPLLPKKGTRLSHSRSACQWMRAITPSVSSGMRHSAWRSRAAVSGAS